MSRFWKVYDWLFRALVGVEELERYKWSYRCVTMALIVDIGMIVALPILREHYKATGWVLFGVALLLTFTALVIYAIKEIRWNHENRKLNIAAFMCAVVAIVLQIAFDWFFRDFIGVKDWARHKWACRWFTMALIAGIVCIVSVLVLGKGNAVGVIFLVIAFVSMFLAMANCVVRALDGTPPASMTSIRESVVSKRKLSPGWYPVFFLAGIGVVVLGLILCVFIAKEKEN